MTVPLTGRQLEILGQVARGLTNREVGRVLGISEATVRKHLENAYQRLGVLNRTGAVAEVWWAGFGAPTGAMSWH